MDIRPIFQVMLLLFPWLHYIYFHGYTTPILILPYNHFHRYHTPVLSLIYTSFHGYTTPMLPLPYTHFHVFATPLLSSPWFLYTQFHDYTSFQDYTRLIPVFTPCPHLHGYTTPLPTLQYTYIHGYTRLIQSLLHTHFMVTIHLFLS